MWIVKMLYDLPRRPIFTFVFHDNPSFLCSVTSTALKPHLVCFFFFLTTMFLLTRKYFFFILVYQSFSQHSRPNPISLSAKSFSDCFSCFIWFRISFLSLPLGNGLRLPHYIPESTYCVYFRLIWITWEYYLSYL